MFKYKSEDELSKMTVAERDQYAADKRAHEKKMVDDAIKAALDEYKSSNPIPEQVITKAQYDEVKEELNQMKEKTNKTEERERPVFKVVKENLQKMRDSIRTGKVESFDVPLNVSKADTLRANVVGNPNAMDLAGIGQLAYPKLTIYDIFRKVPVPKNVNGTIRYVDWDAATTVRAAAAIAEGAPFPESTAKWATYSLQIEKVGDTVPVSEEMIYDAEAFANELENFLRVNVMIKINNDLVTGNGVTPNIKGLAVQVPNYVPVAGGVVDASIYDLIVVGKATISALYGSKYSPNVALMNITDINKYKLKKDNNNNYVMPPFVTRDGQTIDGMLILETNQVTANTMFIGDNRYGAIYEEPFFTVETGYSGTDFTDDMRTMKARKRLNLLIRTVDQTGWLEITDIDAALTTIGS